MNATTQSNSPRFALLDNPLIFWGGVALVLFGAYQGATKFLERDTGLEEVARSQETSALTLPATRTPAASERHAQTTAGRIAPDPAAAFRARPAFRTPVASASAQALEAQALLADLLAASADVGNLSEAQVRELNQYFRELVALGPAAVPALREFLAAGKDVKFKDLGGESVDHASLRVGLIEALGEIGGREAIEALVETLGATAEPLEIAALARALEWQAPGVYRQELLTAARESMELASQAITEARKKPAAEREAMDVSPLFEVMRAFGNTDLLGEMLGDADQTMPPWKVYSMIALAQMPNAEGVDVLRGVLVDEEGMLARQNLFALQMLGQSAAERPAAAEALVELAMVHGQEIPASDWRKLAWTLRGHSYDFGGALAEKDTGASNGSAGLDVTIHSLNLHLKREASDPATWPAQRVDRYITLIDQLLATEPPEEAAYGLESARDWILRRSGVPVAQTSI